MRGYLAIHADLRLGSRLPFVHPKAMLTFERRSRIAAFLASLKNPVNRED
jgi:hypothetical protein